MATSIPSCGPCDMQHVTKTSIVWCTECEEGLCPQCLKHHTASKASRNHNTMPITEFKELPSEVQQITETCDKHNERYTIYCKKHECICCGSCVVIDHIDCREFSRLTDIIDKTKTSEALDEIDESLAELAENIQRLHQNRIKNIKTLSEKKRHIEQEIKKTRSQINNHLDKIQDIIMTKLITTEEKERGHINQSLISLDEKATEISDFQRKIVKIKRHATDLQIFLFLKQLENEISCKYKFMQSLIDTDSLKKIELSYHVHDFMHSFCMDIKTFGDITIEKKPCDFILSRRKEKQAQMLVPHVSNRAVESISLKLHKTVNTRGGTTFGCCILTDGRTVFTNYRSKILKVFNADGSIDFEVTTPTWAFDVVYNSADNTLAVTSGSSLRCCITIIDMQKKQIKKTIPVNSIYYGIAVTDNKFICSAEGKGIQLLNPYDNSTSDIVRDILPSSCHVALFCDKIYHTNNTSNSVTCYDLQGSIQWTFKNESVLKFPRGIAVDNDGMVYVLGNASNNVVVISANGQHYKEVLTARDGLWFPLTLCYERRTNQLLVENNSQDAMVFRLI
ncbi:uncharacterized protein [Mytilus edulis]|uniref:uncharacterized protein n=1 Tax=Mytilus edulis TaxID=6550 RepID=UPI0039F05B45